MVPKQGSGSYITFFEEHPNFLAEAMMGKRYLHRGLAPVLTQALAQVSDYAESLRDPLNLKAMV